MSLENALHQLRENDDRIESQGRFKKQMTDFHKFERRLTAAGFAIEKKSFTIPLMERLSFCWPADRS